MKILVVDDDQPILDALIVGFQLQWQDATVLVAGDGEAGLRAFYEHSPDVVVFDVALPGSGLAACGGITGCAAAQRMARIAWCGTSEETISYALSTPVPAAVAAAPRSMASSTSAYNSAHAAE
jgi:DNA-binding response OmpR family regulator